METSSLYTGCRYGSIGILVRRVRINNDDDDEEQEKEETKKVIVWPKELKKKIKAFQLDMIVKAIRFFIKSSHKNY